MLFHRFYDIIITLKKSVISNNKNEIMRPNYGLVMLKKNKQWRQNNKLFYAFHIRSY